VLPLLIYKEDDVKTASQVDYQAATSVFESFSSKALYSFCFTCINKACYIMLYNFTWHYKPVKTLLLATGLHIARGTPAES
jgi:hypothetical protein